MRRLRHVARGRLPMLGAVVGVGAALALPSSVFAMGKYDNPTYHRPSVVSGKDTASLGTGPLPRTFVAGACAGAVEILLLHHMDVVKTRFQLQRNLHLSRPDPHIYRSIVDAYSKMLRTEGPQALYKGVWPPFMSVVPHKAVKFAAYTQYRNFLTDGGKTPVTFGVSLTAGALAGATESFLVCPFEVVKIALQAQRATPPGMAPMYSGTLDAAKKILRAEGPLALYKGIVPTVTKHTLFNLAYFASYEWFKGRISSMDSLSSAAPSLAGMAAGVVATSINTPWDVVKTRLQHQPSRQAGAPRLYESVTGAFSKILREEGPRAFYKGYVLRCTRLGLGGAVVFSIYEQIVSALNNAEDVW